MVRYVVRRLAGYAHVWFSLANEYDLLFTKSTADWDRIGELVAAEDPHGHLVSIHNFVQHFDHTRPWISHASVQGSAEAIATGREQWGKPVVVDECGYEGDLEYGWGNLSGEELLHRFWDGAVRGGYVGHGETYWDSDGRDLVVQGRSTGRHQPRPDRLPGRDRGRLPDRRAGAVALGLRPALGRSPGRVPGQLPRPRAATRAPRPAASGPVAGRRPRHLGVHGRRRLPGVHQTFVLVPLPAKPYQAVRLVAV